MSATLVEIAKVAGVSAATVSRALNGQAGVSDRLRRRIREIAERMGYAPHATARALVTGRVPFLGLIVPDLSNPFYPSLARGAEEEAHAHGYSLLLLNTSRSADRLRQAFDLLTSRRVGGLIVAEPLDRLGANHPDWDVLRQATVMAGTAAPEGSGIATVDVDDRLGGTLVGEHLVDQGWRRVGFLAGAPADRSTRDRLAGLQDALARGGHAPAQQASGPGDWTVQSGYEQARRLLDRADRPDAIFAANDLLALGAARAAAQSGLVLGRDLGLVGYDDIDAVQWTAVPITSVAQPEAEVGREAARRLIALADGHADGDDVRLVPSLVVRASSLHPDPYTAPGARILPFPRSKESP